VSEHDHEHGDVIAVLVHDHREVQGFFSELDKTRDGADPEQRKDLVDQVTIELVRHSVAEEQFLYPAVRKHVPGGGELADEEIREHAEMERTLKELEGLQPSDAAFEPTVRRLMQEVSAHIAEEESTLFPRLQSVCGTEELMDLGKKVRASKKIGPTRPHPNAPDTPPGNFAAPGLGLIDRIRDALTGRGQGS
jgi:hemerythrin superfamily protein